MPADDSDNTLSFSAAPEAPPKEGAAPYATGSEQVVLARLMTDADAYDDVADRLAESDFYRAEHRLIYAAIRSLGEQGQSRDVFAVASRLDLAKTLERAGGMGYLNDLCTEASEIVDLRHHADLIAQLALRRRLMSAADSIARMARETAHEPIDEVIDRADNELFKLSQERLAHRSGAEPLHKLIEPAMAMLKRRYEADRGYSGLETGFVDLDRITDGLQGSDLVILAARPSKGKTAFSLCVANHCARYLGRPTLFFSLEMPKEQLINRLISMNGSIDQAKIRSGDLSEDDWDQLSSACRTLEGCPLYVDDTPALTASDIRTRTRRFVRQHSDCALVVIDYLQLIAMPPTRREYNQNVLLSEVSRSLKVLAREMRIPVMALSQLNRRIETGSGDRLPQLADLRDSGAIEQDADLVMFLHTGANQQPGSDATTVVIGKHRNGETGRIKLHFNAKFTRFENYSFTGEDDDIPVGGSTKSF